MHPANKKKSNEGEQRDESYRTEGCKGDRRLVRVGQPNITPRMYRLLVSSRRRWLPLSGNATLRCHRGQNRIIPFCHFSHALGLRVYFPGGPDSLQLISVPSGGVFEHCLVFSIQHQNRFPGLQLQLVSQGSGVPCKTDPRFGSSFCPIHKRGFVLGGFRERQA